MYCGNKIILDDFRSFHCIIDEARIKEAEAERVVRLKELESEKWYNYDDKVVITHHDFDDNKNILSQINIDI